MPAYHILSYGFIPGELARRITGTRVEELLTAEILAPLGLRDTHLGLPSSALTRRVPIRGHGSIARPTACAVNRRAMRRAVIPAAGVSTTARDLATFYEALLRGGELDGVRILRPETISSGRKPSSDGEIDRFVGLPIRWSYGFQLGGPVDDPDVPRPMGKLSSQETFGHNGSNVCLAWADRRRDLVFVYLTNLLTSGYEGAYHQCALSDAVIAACR
jgi:CubicO group peptidase (beta-lactamase class C family)